jgi:hypothetical protein
MSDMRLALGAALLSYICLSACGSSSTAPAVSPAIAAKPDVVIGFEGANHMCVVALVTEPQGSTIPCVDLVAFLKDELRLPSGAIYDTHVAASADPTDIDKTTQSLKNAGFRFIGGH